MALDTWLLFVVAAIGISLSPGPNGLLALTHGALHGPRKTLYTIAGGLTGFTAVIALCTFGIGALIGASVFAFTVLKWAGGAYLVWLGIRLWRSPPLDLSPRDVTQDTRGGVLFREGLLSAATNPKALLFFSAFLPQFIDPARSLAAQFAAMAATFAVTEFVTEYALAFAANRVRPWLARMGRRFNRICGGIFVAIGVALPLRT